MKFKEYTGTLDSIWIDGVEYKTPSPNMDEMEVKGIDYQEEEYRDDYGKRVVIPHIEIYLKGGR